MKSQTYILSLLLITVIISSTRCKDKEDCPYCGSEYKTIPQEMKDWALFEEGSWWVYRLAEDTTVFDTVRRVGKINDSRSNPRKCRIIYAPADMCTEVLTYNLQHSNPIYFGTPLDSSIRFSDEINLYYPPGGGVFLYYYGGGYGGGVIFGLSPILIGEYYGNFTLIDTFSDTNFNGINVSKGFHSSIVTNIPFNGNLMKNIYWGKNIGILKVEVPPNQTWELINYEVKQ